MIDKTNLYEVNQNVRTVMEGRTEYQSTLPHHSPNHDRLHDLTSYQNDFSRQNIDNIEKVIEDNRTQ